MKRKGILKKLTASMITCTMLVTTCISGYAATTSNEVTEREKRNAKLSMNSAAEGMVLLENKNNALPIASKGNIALFGGGAHKTIKGGSGSGDVNQRYMVSVWDAFKNAGYNITSSEWLEGFKQKYDQGLDEWNRKNANNPYKAYLPPFQLADYQLTDNDIATASSTDTAIYVVSRSSGEGIDRTTTKGDYYLTDAEYANIEKIAKSFKNTIVLLNVGGVIDTKFVDEIPELDSVLLMSQAGMEGGTAVVKLLNGEITPSGKLSDTWAVNYSDYPTAKTFSGNDGDSLQEDYTEGIYLGYRYFDSFNVTPAYEFGYGLSYTSFEVNVASVEADEEQVTVKVKVKNTGKYSGKEVAEVYFTAPEGKLDKPYQELVAYGKTDILAPGESQTLTISYNTSEMSSYSEEDAAYIMEKGDYIIRVGNSSRNTHVGAVLTLDATVTTEQLSNQMETEKNIDTISDAGVISYSYEGEASEISNALRIQLSAQSLELIDGNNSSEYDDELVTSYVAKDVDEDQDTASSVDEEQTITDNNYSEATNETVEVEKSGVSYDVSNSEATVEEFLDIVNGNDLSAANNENQITINSIDEEPIEINSPSYTEIKEEVDVKEGSTLYDVYNKEITMKQFIAGLSVEKLADIVEGIGTAIATGPVIGAEANSVQGGAGETTGKYYETDGIPNIVLADGPAGIRITQSYVDNNQTYYQYATAWPIGILLAQTWNNELMEELSKAVGEEMTEFGVTLWLAPGMNIHRDPLCGRNFEYFSEDPFLTGAMGLAATRGVQSYPGIGVTIKHYAANNQENNRSHENNTVTERTLREIYLKGYEMAIKSAQPMAIMTAFNKINGTFTSADYDLLTDIARGEWNFDGLIMTDWYVNADPAQSMHAGNDLIMPGGSQETIIKAVIDYAPVFGEDGYVATKTVYDYRGKASFVEQWNDFILSAGGDVTVSTKVPAGTALNAKVSQMIDEGKTTIEFDTNNTQVIEETFEDVQAEMESVVTTEEASTETVDDTSTQIIDEEASEITTDAAVEIGEDDVTSEVSSRDRIVTYYGSYANNNTIYLGDLQKSAMRVLNIIMQSMQFAKMYEDQGVKVGPYTAKYGDLKNYMTIAKGDITKDSNSTDENSGGSTGGSSSGSSGNSSSGSSSTGNTTTEVKNKCNKNSDGTWSFVNSNGEKVTGWIKDGNTWYHLNSSGTMETGWLKDTNGTWYFLNSDGAMKTGWLKDADGSWYFLNANGAMKTGWLKDTDGRWYYLNASGSMKTGWLKDTDGKWYYLNSSGSMKTGWFKDTNGKWYYLNSNGAMAVNTIVDGYKVDSTGAYIS